MRYMLDSRMDIKINSFLVFSLVCLLASGSCKPCEDHSPICKHLLENMPGFCQMREHQDFAENNCSRTCGYCQSKRAFEHGTNLIWAQSPVNKLYTASRLVAIEGEPSMWVASRSPHVTYVTAPVTTWEFRALGFHWEDNAIFWSEATHKKIQTLTLNGSTSWQTLLEGTSSLVYGIAVDWVSRNLYYTDALYDWIMVTSTRTANRAHKIVVQDKLESPHGLAVYPQKGYLIWSDWGVRPKIEISDLLGENRRILVERSLVRPRGLSIDYSNNALYWVDSYKATVELVQFNGEGRKVLHQEDGTSFFGVALYKEYLFVTERSRGMLKVFDRQKSLVSFTLGNVPFDILMYDSSQQPGTPSECAQKGCEHLCVQDPLTGASCVCGSGYVGLDPDNVKCKRSKYFIHPSHLYAIGDGICQYPANVGDMSLANVTLDSQCFLRERHGYMTLTFDARANMLYFFGNQTKTISMIPLEAGGNSKVLTGGTGIVKGMALDWIAGNLYWTDSSHGTIKVATKNGSYQHIILENLNNPVGIVVHPGRGEIYWTDHGHLPDVGAKVEKANLDGSNRESIMEDNLGQPNHLYIDFNKDCLFWTDSMLNHVRRMDLNTGRISVFYHKDKITFYGLSMFKDYMLWTDTHDWNGIHIARIDKEDNIEKVRGIIHPENGLAADLITFDVANQPMFYSPCQPDQNRCSQLCLAKSDNTSSCLCGTGYSLADDGITCFADTVMDQFILVNDGYQNHIFQVNAENGAVKAIALKPIHEPVALAFDPYEYKVFWSDNKVNVIREATIDGKYERTVLLLPNGKASLCDGLAVDYVNKLLFYTDTGNDVIGVVSLRDYDLHTFIIEEDMDEPRAIVVSPNEGQIYWSDWGKNARIERANMDGTMRVTLVQFQNRAWPNGLALDIKERALYWVDARADTISVLDLVTNNTRVLLEEDGSHFYSLDIMGEYLYVSDWTKNYLRRMKKEGGELTRFGENKFTRLFGIKSFNSSEIIRGTSVCVMSVCEHLCLPRAHKTYRCMCKLGYYASGPSCLKATTTTTEAPVTFSGFNSTMDFNVSTTSAASMNTTFTSTSSNTSYTSTSSNTSFNSTSSNTSYTSTSSMPSASSDLTSSLFSSSVTSISSSPSTSVPSSSISPKPSIQSTSMSAFTSTITKVPTVMTSSGDSQSTTVIDTTLSPGPFSPTAPFNSTSADNTTSSTPVNAAASTADGQSMSLIYIVVAVVIAVVLAIVIIIGVVIGYRRRHKYYFNHGRLVEAQSRSSTDFYQIAFSGQDEDSVRFSSGGIENPTYDYLNQPDAQIGSDS